MFNLTTQTITLIRHGESEGNVDRSIYERKPDYTLRLTSNGFAQAIDLGRKIREESKGKYVKLDYDSAIYLSPYWRARDTLQGLRIGLGDSFNPNYIYEDARLREQEWGGRIGVNVDETVEQERNEIGHYYYRFAGGESCADVEDRISSFLDTLWRDIERKGPRNIFIVCHGMTMRVFLKRWLHLSIEEFERIKNPPNCSRYTLIRQHGTRKFIPEPSCYQLHDAPKNKFQYEPFIVDTN